MVEFNCRRQYRVGNSNSKKRLTCFNIPITTVKANSNLDTTLSVKTVLKDLNLSGLHSIFEQEEVNLRCRSEGTNTKLTLHTKFQINLTAFFTLNDSDLKTIGVDDEMQRKKILGFINDFSTPQKPKKIQAKNQLYRH